MNNKDKPNPNWTTCKFEQSGVADEAMIKMLEARYPTSIYDFTKSGPNQDGLFTYTVKEK